MLVAVDENGDEVFYDIPDDELAKYKRNSMQMTDEIRERLFPGKEKLTKEDAHGVIQVPTAPVPGSDVEGYRAMCRYWIVDDYGNLIWWYDWC